MNVNYKYIHCIHTYDDVFTQYFCLFFLKYHHIYEIYLGLLGGHTLSSYIYDGHMDTAALWLLRAKRVNFGEFQIFKKFIPRRRERDRSSIDFYFSYIYI